MCTGCGACSAICPKNCIRMADDRSGFEIPIVDESICIHCGLCEKVCPVLNDYGNKTSSAPLRIYAARNKNEVTVKESSSGGIFSIFAENVLKRNGVVYGVTLTTSLTAEHIRIESLDSLYKIRGSKYLHSTSANVFAKVRSDLNSGREVLFSGTPCQIAAVHQFLRKSYPNLLCMEVVCHGVPSNLVFQKYVEYLEKRYRSHIINVNFRDKRKGWLTNYISFYFENGKIVTQKSAENWFTLGYVENLFLRECCSDCKFKAMKSNSDITLGDMWGIESLIPSYEVKNGVSMVCVNSQAGESAFAEIKHLLDDSTEVRFTDIVKYNRCIIDSAPPHKQRNYFLQQLTLVPVKKLLSEVLGVNRMKVVSNRIKSVKLRVICHLVVIKHKLIKQQS